MKQIKISCLVFKGNLTFYPLKENEDAKDQNGMSVILKLAYKKYFKNFNTPNILSRENILADFTALGKTTNNFYGK